MRSSGNAETRRHRQTGSQEDVELQRKRLNDKKKVEDSLSEKQKALKSFALRLLVVLLFAAASMTILFVPTTTKHSPTAADDSFPSSVLGSLRNSSGEQRLLDWLQNSAELGELRGKLKPRGLKVGLVNFHSSSLLAWEIFTGGEAPKLIPFEPASGNISWSDLYPEWIDEEERWNVPKCPQLPMPSSKHKKLKLDLVIAKVPCNRTSRANWSRDVNRLHALLVAARVAVDATRRHHMHVVLLDECRPAPNLFTCKELVEQKGVYWLFKVDLRRLASTLELPVGSCELAVPIVEGRQAPSPPRVPKSRSREAYATILHSAQLYVCGAISLAQSIRMSGSKRDMVILVDENIHPDHRQGLEAAGWKVRQIQRIRNPKAEPESYNEWNYSKFRLWQLTEYVKLIYIDADIILLRNLDFLFQMPEISATGNHESLFNSGVMVIEPSNCTFQLLMQQINEVESYNGGDQGYLNEVYTWWHRLPKHMNFLKHFGLNDTEELEHRVELFNAEPPKVYAMHFLGLKPWLCFRDYDCNWNQQKLHEYANDGVHARWWRVHDGMPKKLQRYCLLRSKQKASLEWDRRQAEAAKFPDGHWKMKIHDSRLRTCFEEFCYWESMLWHWGENETETA